MFGLGKNKENEEAVEVTKVENQPQLDIAETDKVKEIDKIDKIDKTTDTKESKNKENVPETNVQELISAEKEIPPLTYKENKAMKRCRYEQNIANNPKFKNIYVIQNKRTKQIVELRAAGSAHACTIIGWKPNRVKVMSVKLDIIKSTSDLISIGEKQSKQPIEPETTTLK